MTQPKIHSSAVIETGASLGENVEVGPFCCVGAGVTLAAGVKLVSHVSLSGHLHIGEGTIVYPFAALGYPPQDLKYRGESSRVVIGKNNVIRENVTVHPGTTDGAMETVIGDNCLLMVGGHVAHDCRVGNNVIMANNATLAGHVQVGDHAIIGGLSAVKQHTRIGEHAIVGGMSGVERDVIPYGMVLGERAFLNGLNLVGLRRRGFATEDIHQLLKAYQHIFDSKNNVPFEERVQGLRETLGKNPYVQTVMDFILSGENRSLCMPKTT